MSRDPALPTYKRRYYFQYLAPAKANSLDETVQEHALLKELKNKPMWQGYWEVARNRITKNAQGFVVRNFGAYNADAEVLIYQFNWLNP